MNPTLWRPGRYTRSGLIRRWWHQCRGHKVLKTVVRHYQPYMVPQFVFRPGWVCPKCWCSWA